MVYMWKSQELWLLPEFHITNQPEKLIKHHPDIFYQIFGFILRKDFHDTINYPNPICKA